MWSVSLWLESDKSGTVAHHVLADATETAASPGKKEEEEEVEKEEEEDSAWPHPTDKNHVTDLSLSMP